MGFGQCSRRVCTSRRFCQERQWEPPPSEERSLRSSHRQSDEEPSLILILRRRQPLLGPPPSVRLHDDSRPHWPDHFGRCLPLPEQLLIEPQSVVAGVWLGRQQAREAWPYVDTRPPPPSTESPCSSDVRFLGPNPHPPSDIRCCVRSHIPFVS